MPQYNHTPKLYSQLLEICLSPLKQKNTTFSIPYIEGALYQKVLRGLLTQLLMLQKTSQQKIPH